MRLDYVPDETLGGSADVRDVQVFFSHLEMSEAFASPHISTGLAGLVLYLDHHSGRELVDKIRSLRHNYENAHDFVQSLP